MRHSICSMTAVAVAFSCVAELACAQQIEQAPLPPPTTGVSEPPTTRVSEPPTTSVSEPPTTSVSEPPPTSVSEPPTTGVSDPPSAAAAAPPSSPTKAPRQVAEQPSTSLTTQDCVSMPTPAEQTDCLNQIAAEGNYMPTPKPAPGSQAPMAYRLPLGKRQISPP